MLYNFLKCEIPGKIESTKKYHMATKLRSSEIMEIYLKNGNEHKKINSPCEELKVFFSMILNMPSLMGNKQNMPDIELIKYSSIPVSHNKVHLHCVLNMF